MTDEEHIKVGENLKYYRKIVKGYTQKKIYQLTGIYESQLSRYEHGREDIRYSDLNKLCRVLEITKDQLYDLRDNTTHSSDESCSESSVEYFYQDGQNCNDISYEHNNEEALFWRATAISMLFLVIYLVVINLFYSSIITLLIAAFGIGFCALLLSIAEYDINPCAQLICDLIALLFCAVFITINLQAGSIEERIIKASIICITIIYIERPRYKKWVNTRKNKLVLSETCHLPRL